MFVPLVDFFSEHPNSETPIWISGTCKKVKRSNHNNSTTIAAEKKQAELSTKNSLVFVMCDCEGSKTENHECGVGLCVTHD